MIYTHYWTQWHKVLLDTVAIGTHIRSRDTIFWVSGLRSVGATVCNECNVGGGQVQMVVNIIKYIKYDQI